MRLPRLTIRRLSALVSVAGMAVLVILYISQPGDEGLLLVGTGLLGLLGLATMLPFVGYRLEVTAVDPQAPDHHPRPPRLARKTTRRLIEMIVVLTVVFGLAILMGHRRDRFRRLAEMHSRRSLHELRDGQVKPTQAMDIPGDQARRLNLLAEYHYQLATKYRRAAARPWMPVPPDPPAPK